MCSLPNIQARDLEELSQYREKQVKKSEDKTVKIIIPYYPSLENSIQRGF
jgi:hypothetical protein